MIKKSSVLKTSEGAYTLILTKDNDVLLQQRNVDPNVENSGKIAMFGGAIEDNEELFDGLKRELFEELELNIDEYRAEKLNIYYKTRELDGIDHCANVWIVYDVDQKSLVQHEGNAIISSQPENIVDNMQLSRVTKLALQDLINKK